MSFKLQVIYVYYKCILILKKLWKYIVFRFGVYISFGYFMRYIHLYFYRIYYKYPNGPNGLPFFGVVFIGKYFGSIKWHANILMKYSNNMVSYPTMKQQFILINNPNIARKLYNNYELANRYEPYLSKVNNTITFLNGKEWKKRRQNIHSNIIATMNSKFIIKGSVDFMRNIMIPYMNAEFIKGNNGVINVNVSELMRPLTFNLVLYSCIGKHVSGLNDPFYNEFMELTHKFWLNFRKRMFTSFAFSENNAYLNKKWKLEELGETLRF